MVWVDQEHRNTTSRLRPGSGPRRPPPCLPGRRHVILTRARTRPGLIIAPPMSFGGSRRLIGWNADRCEAKEAMTGTMANVMAPTDDKKEAVAWI